MQKFNTFKLSYSGKGSLNLDWPTRFEICLGIARGIAYLHEESTVRIVHRDIKASNVLIDADLNPKISDFGLAKLGPTGSNSHITTRVMGTYGYAAPEYVATGMCPHASHQLIRSYSASLVMNCQHSMC